VRKLDILWKIYSCSKEIQKLQGVDLLGELGISDAVDEKGKVIIDKETWTS
jgi:hypothetical protein